MQKQLTKVLKVLLGKPSDWRLVNPREISRPHIRINTIGPLLAIVIIFVGWFAFTDTQGDDGVGFALFIGSVSILLMAWSNFLSTRHSLLEKLFGGLDKMYWWHRWFGMLSVVTMWLHTQTVDDVKGIRGASRDVADAAEDLAETGSTLLYILIAISILRWIPTRWWRLSHKFLIVPYVFACWHFYTATKPYANNSPWGWWFTSLMILGVAAWFYRVVWRDMVRRGTRYRVSAIDRSADSIELELQPVRRHIRYRSGQFAFIKVNRKGLREPHPFTIASHPREEVLRFVVKDLGDWTHQIGKRLQIGNRVTVEGPYGKLPLFPREDSEETIWVAGGVGITPFLGAALGRSRHNGPRPHLFYCVRSLAEASGLADLEKAHADGRIHLHLHASADGCRLRAEDIQMLANGRDISNAHVVMCGPDSLVKNFRRVFRSMGVRHIHVEAFDIRTGVGPDLSREIDDITRDLDVRTLVNTITRSQKPPRTKE